VPDSPPISGHLRLVEDPAVKIVEGTPGTGFMIKPEDASILLETCFSHETRNALLYAENLPVAFFDLSSGQAGAILQRLRNYGVRLAVVCAPGTEHFSTHFGAMLAEEQKGRFFGVFPDRAAARDWLAA
jgi:hypothetical protein